MQQNQVSRDSYLFSDSNYIDSIVNNIFGQVDLSSSKNVRLQFGTFNFEFGQIKKRDVKLLEKLDLDTFKKLAGLHDNYPAATHVCLYPGYPCPLLKKTSDGYMSIDGKGNMKNHNLPLHVERDHLLSVSAIVLISKKMPKSKKK